MHAPRGRGHPRVLYWFRTPPNVRVGRAALDEDAIRAIEDSNPDIEFDWTRMLKERAVAPAPAERTGRDRRDREGRRPGRGTPQRPASAAASSAEPPLDTSREARPAARDDAENAMALGARTKPGSAGPDQAARAGTTDEPVSLPPGLHVEERLGTEGFSRLRARHAELLARISEQVTDATRLEELRAQAERLNPDTWITDAEAEAGIEGFDAAYAALRGQLGRRKRRSRRGGRRRRSKAGGRPGDASAAQPRIESETGREGEAGQAENHQAGKPTEPKPPA
jgi:hypothetical protein